MSKKQTNLGKSVHMYSSLEEMDKQFSHDVNVMGEELNDFVYQFDPRNPYDQEVLATILTNIMAWLQIHADLECFDLAPGFKEKYEIALENYRQLYAEQLNR